MIKVIDIMGYQVRVFLGVRWDEIIHDEKEMSAISVILDGLRETSDNRYVGFSDVELMDFKNVTYMGYSLTQHEEYYYVMLYNDCLTSGNSVQGISPRDLDRFVAMLGVSSVGMYFCEMI